MRMWFSVLLVHLRSTYGWYTAASKPSGEPSSW